MVTSSVLMQEVSPFTTGSGTGLDRTNGLTGRNCLQVRVYSQYDVIPGSLMLFVISVGLNLYSSSDLLNWDFEVQALSPVPDTLIGPGTVVERPKIIYSQETNLWNLWFHSDNSSYGLLRQGVATSPNITGE